MYTFNDYRNNARRRGKEWDITLAEFEAFCLRTGFMETKGRNGHQDSLDREVNSRGYVIDNVRVLSVSKNSQKADGDCPF